MALEKLCDDDRVVQDRIGSQAMIFLECHDEARRSLPEIASIETQSRKNSPKRLSTAEPCSSSYETTSLTQITSSPISPVSPKPNSGRISLAEPLAAR